MTAENTRRDQLVVLAAGGTAGHVFPAEALATELMQRGHRLVAITDRRGGTWKGALANIETHRILAGGIAGKSFAARLKSGPELAIGTWQARGLLKRLRPKAVVGFGGYASVPTMLAACFGGCNTAIHEQNAVLGRANRLLAPRVRRIATSFEKSEGVPEEAAAKVIHTGMPVRAAVAAVAGRPYPPLQSGRPVSLMVIGGSQGAHVFSEVVPAALESLGVELKARLRVSQQCRPEDLDRTRDRYRKLGIAAKLAAFFDDLPERLAVAHLLIGRAGASTAAEMLVVGRPGILVPYPHAIDDHQTRNAHAIDEAGAGWLMPETSFTPGSLAARLESLFGLPAILEKAAACAKAAGNADAAKRLADMVCGLLKSNGANGPNAERRAA
ncbi:MAG: undecaprenyldiphospho-muramoylpentapeptide beta-N-acetylglucosaminyltransferase [Rhodospirillales bacterium]